MLKMTIDNEEVLSNNDISIKEEILSPSSTILNNVYPKSWELDKDYTSRFYYPKDYSKLNIQNFSIEPEEVGKTIQVNGSATLTDVDTSKESRVLRLLGQTSQTGTPTPSSPIPINVVSGDNEIDICGKNLLPNNATSQTMNGITFTINSDKSITINGTARGRADLYIYGQSTDNGNYVKIPKGIYSIDTSKITNGKLFYMFREKTAGTTFATPSNSSAISLMSSQDCYFYGIVLAVENGVTLNNYTIYPMLEKGNQATTYEPYIGNSYPITLPSGMFLGGIGTYLDGIFKAVNGNSYYDSLTQAQKNELTYGSWYLHKEIGKAVLDENTSIESGTGYVAIGRFAINGYIGIAGTASQPGAISTHFTSRFTTDNGSIFTSAVDKKINVINTAYRGNYAGFKTWLGETKPIVYYILSTPTNTPIEDTTLLEQLESLSS